MSKQRTHNLWFIAWEEESQNDNRCQARTSASVLIGRDAIPETFGYRLNVIALKFLHLRPAIIMSDIFTLKVGFLFDSLPCMSEWIASELTGFIIIALLQ